MTVKYYHPYWGMEQLSLKDFAGQIRSAGFDGAEVAIDPDKDDPSAVRGLLQEQGLDLIVQHPFARGNTADELLKDYGAKLEKLARVKPTKINCHTGKDHYNLQQNLAFLALAAELSEKYGVEICHEIHRGRFSFCAMGMGPYLDAFANLKLTADFSHWCVVSESLLEDQQDILNRTISHCVHLHARVGYAQGPQAPHPGAPEYRQELAAHTDWWLRIHDHLNKAGREEMTVTCESGPAPYMHTLPFTNQPVLSSYDVNLFMKNYLDKILVPCKTN